MCGLASPGWGRRGVAKTRRLDGPRTRADPRKRRLFSADEFPMRRTGNRTHGRGARAPGLPLRHECRTGIPDDTTLRELIRRNLPKQMRDQLVARLVGMSVVAFQQPLGGVFPGRAVERMVGVNGQGAQ